MTSYFHGLVAPKDYNYNDTRVIIVSVRYIYTHTHTLQIISMNKLHKIPPTKYHLIEAELRAIQKSSSLNNKFWRMLWRRGKKVRRMDSQQKKKRKEKRKNGKLNRTRRENERSDGKRKSNERPCDCSQERDIRHSRPPFGVDCIAIQ